VSASGSDWQTWRVREVATGKDRSDVVEWIKFSSIAWTKDGKGFFYARYDAPKEDAAYEAINENEKVYYHRLGTPQSEDELVYARPDHPKWGFDPSVTDDGRYLVLEVKIGTDPNNDVFYQDLQSKPAADGKRVTHELVAGFSAGYAFVGNDRGTFWFRTDSDAPRGRVVAIDTKGKGPLKSRTRELVPQSEDTLRSVRVVADRFVASWLHDAHSRVTIHDLRGKLQREVELPGIGSTGGFSGRRAHDETFFSYEGYTTPSQVHRLDPKTGKLEPFRAPKLKFDPNDYVTEQVFYTSKDGTKVPISLSWKKGTKKTGDVPTYLYGYGGFDIALTPSFSVPNLVWMEMGGLLAVPNLRGGGEYGEAWHQAGTKLHKQNVFDDFIAAAEWLVAEGWTKRERLAIGGRSNGGLLVGAVMTQRPDLFAVALPGVGVMDMLRFNQFTIGWAWESDYGSPSDPEQFQALYAYSPYHNLEKGTAYPATLVYTADHDDRVVPAHSFKFAAALQHAHEGERPVLIRIDTKAGHGRGKPVSKTIDEWADLWAFTATNVGMQVPEVKG
jgi:prolyl oligopeptidase